MARRSSSTLDLAIVGGGIVGLALAWRAGAAGWSVAVIERGELGGGATGVAAGMLAPVSEVEFGAEGMAALRLALRSAERWPGFARELESASGIDVGLRRGGILMVARDDDEARELERQVAFRQKLGLRATRLRASQARELEPSLAPTVRLAVHAPDDHSVDPRRVVAALKRACERGGVELREHTAAGLHVEDGRVAGARTWPAGLDVDGGSDGDVFLDGPAEPAGACELVHARRVVVAGGAWSGGVAGLPERARVRVRPVKGQILRLRDPAGPGLLAGVVRFQGGYVVPRGDGRYVLGASMEERGFDPSVTAGTVYELLRDAHELVPGVSELCIEELGAGYRPSTPDNLPLIGPGALPGLAWATGHHRNGILLAPLTADLAMASLAAGDGARAIGPDEVGSAGEGVQAEGTDGGVPAEGADGLPAGEADAELLALCDPGRAGSRAADPEKDAVSI